MKAVLPIIVSLVPFVPALAAPAGTVGQRPYEMVWANRTNDAQPPLIDFEDLAGWRVEARSAVASFERTREQQLWGDYVGKLTYRGTGADPQVRLLPPNPISISGPFDAVTLWCYGNNWGWAPDSSTPQVGVTALFEDAAGREFSVYLYHVDWTEWNLLHRRLTPEQIERARSGARFKGLLITNARNKQDRVLFFDNLAVFAEQFPPLSFEPRPERGIAMFPGQSSGANTGPGRLSFPTRPETILPPNLTADFKTSLTTDGTAFVFTYVGSDGRLTYRYEPKTGTWGDLEAGWEPAAAPGKRVVLRPCVGGGVYLTGGKGATVPAKAEHLGTAQKGETVESRWRIEAAGVSAEVTYMYRLWNKSLVIDVLAPGGRVGEVRFGRATGLEQPRLVTNPFYPVEGGRPAVAVSGPADAPLFVAGNADWYLSNGSVLWAANSVAAEGVVYNGGTRYVPLTNGKRNDCFERFFVTVSPRYEEVLPVIANPASPWKRITGTRVWRAHGASNREQDTRYWTDAHRHGLTRIVVTDHETGWRDGGESFTFRTRPAPGKGGDQGQSDYARLMQDKLGFVYGPYNNFTDFAPVNEYWSFDMVSRTPDNQLQHAWMRCYAPKPARAVEYCAKLTPRIQEKFRFSTAYCDVHTAVAPWHRVDYDPRVPGAGTFAAVFYSFGEIMLLQKQAWHGPVYSEGNYHSFYTGLTDGNYGQDQSYRPAENPWLVDFDLRRMHDLGCNFGMGNLEMFYANVPQPHDTAEQRDVSLDRFLAATVAFGHPGFLVFEGGMASALRSYYMLQQLHSRYCLTNAAEIRYAAADGALLDTSRAIASGAYKRSQVVTRYADGTVTAANGSKTERMSVEAYGRRLDLPPNGYAGWTADGAIEVLSGDPDGHRCDYAVTPAYLYVDGRGKFTRWTKAAGNGIGICRILPGGAHEVIPFNNSECGFAVRASAAVALDKESKELGPAQLRTARGLTYAVPIKGAFSYRLSGAGEAEPIQLHSDRDEAVAGEHVVVRGRTAHEAIIPADAQPGRRIWLEFDGAWIDFTVAPLADVQLALEGNALRVTLTSHLQRAEDFALRFAGHEQRVRLEPLRPRTASIDLGAPAAETAEVLAVEISAAGLRQSIETGLRTVRENAVLAAFPEKWTAGQRLRGGAESAEFAQSGGYVRAGKAMCGEAGKSGLLMHPPYMTGAGYCFALYEPLKLPADQPAAFRAFVGKQDGSDPGDGILYRLAVLDDAGAETVAAQTVVAQHAWLALEANLSRWAGREVRLKLVADVGERNDSTGDWACWAGMRLETPRAVLTRRLEPDFERYRREPGPHPVAGLTVQELRKAKAGWLRYDGKGLDGPGSYGTLGALNGLAIGDMAAAHGDEVKGKWAEKVGVPLKPEVIASLGARNQFVLKNPNHDCFSLRRVWLDLELVDGRRCSSEISTATFSQPPEWPHAEGIRVPYSKDIAVEVWFTGLR